MVFFSINLFLTCFIYILIVLNEYPRQSGLLIFVPLMMPAGLLIFTDYLNWDEYFRIFNASPASMLLVSLIFHSVVIGSIVYMSYYKSKFHNINKIIKLLVIFILLLMILSFVGCVAGLRDAPTHL